MYQPKIVLICGSRYGSQALYDLVSLVVSKQCYVGNQIIVGDAKGVDSHVVVHAETIGCCYTSYGVADIARNGAPSYEKVPGLESIAYAKMAYRKRDEFMVRRADIVICLWNGYSTGTKHVADYALNLNKIVHLRTHNRVVYR